MVADSEPGVSSIIRDKSVLLPADVSVATALITAACLYIFLGIVGIWAALRLNLFIWWNSQDWKNSGETVIIIALGAIIVVLNTVVNVSWQIAGYPDISESSHWILSITPQSAVALSLHAAVTEEIMFRLFFFSAAAWTASHFLNRKKTLITGAVISCFLFGLMHSGNFLFPFFLGFIMVYIYFHRGLIPVMLIHFLADSIPFVIISVVL